MNLIAITNPSDESAEAGFVYTQAGYITTKSIIPEYGDKIEDGAQIVILSDIGTPSTRVWQFIAERVDDEIWIRVNNAIGDYIDVEDVGPSVAEGNVKQLEAYTVFGWSDDDEPFRCVVTAASPAAAYAAAVEAAAYEAAVGAAAVEAAVMGEGYQYMVKSAVVLKGDVVEADVTGEATKG